MRKGLIITAAIGAAITAAAVPVALNYTKRTLPAPKNPVRYKAGVIHAMHEMGATAGQLEQVFSGKLNDTIADAFKYHVPPYDAAWLIMRRT